jgi:alkaline phosphatase
VAKADRVKDISLQLLEPSSSNLKTRLKVAMGGGRWYLLPKTQFDPEYPTLAGKRSDGRDLTAEWVASSSGRSNAKYVWNKNDFDAVTASNTDYLLGLFEPEHMNYEADRATHDAANNKGGEPSLTDMTLKALDILKKNKNGFFLHVEAGRIDHAHHGGNAKRALLDAVELSKAVSLTVDYLKTNGLFEDTLIIVTADHSHTLTIAGYPHRGNPILGLVKEVPRTDGSATALVKDSIGLPYTTLSYANGPGYLGSGTATISGATAVFQTGVKSFRNSADGTGLTTPAYDSFGPSKSDNGASRVDLTSVDTTALNFMQEAAVPLSSETHGGEDVAIFAIGPWSHYVRGSMEQHYIFHVMAKAFGITKF